MLRDRPSINAPNGSRRLRGDELPDRTARNVEAARDRLVRLPNPVGTLMPAVGG